MDGKIKLIKLIESKWMSNSKSKHTMTFEFGRKRDAETFGAHVGHVWTFHLFLFKALWLPKFAKRVGKWDQGEALKSAKSQKLGDQTRQRKRSIESEKSKEEKGKRMSPSAEPNVPTKHVAFRPTHYSRSNVGGIDWLKLLVKFDWKQIREKMEKKSPIHRCVERTKRE